MKDSPQLHEEKNKEKRWENPYIMRIQLIIQIYYCFNWAASWLLYEITG